MKSTDGGTSDCRGGLDAGEAASESDVRVRWQELLEAEKILMTDLGSIPVFEKGSATLQNTKVKNLVIKPCNVLSFQYVEKN